jgi:hypothetical protein
MIESNYGKFIVNRHCDFQAESLIKTGLPHIQGELATILTLIKLLPQNCIVVDAGANLDPRRARVWRRRFHGNELRRCPHVRMGQASRLYGRPIRRKHVRHGGVWPHRGVRGMSVCSCGLIGLAAPVVVCGLAAAYGPAEIGVERFTTRLKRGYRECNDLLANWR